MWLYGDNRNYVFAEGLQLQAASIKNAVCLQMNSEEKTNISRLSCSIN